MFVTKLKSVLAVILIIGLPLAGSAGLRYQTQAADQPKANGEAPAKDQKPVQPIEPQAKTDQERIVGWWTIVNDDSKRKGELWEIGKHQIVMNANRSGFRARSYFYRLDPAKSPKQIDINVTTISGTYGGDVPINETNRPIGVIKGIYELKAGELRLCLGEMDKDRPAAFPDKPAPGQELIVLGTQFKSDGGLTGNIVRNQADGKKVPKDQEGKPMTTEEKLRVLIDQVLAAHGGEDRLSKLQFTMTVKHSNGETQHYFVQPPRHLRWETTHRDRTGKRIVILFPEGRRWWTREPNEGLREFRPTGVEPRMEYWLDYVKFFGPRQVLRLKDASHKVALLDEEAKIGDRAAVGVVVTGPQFKGKMYFDKETHLLLKGTGSDIAREVTFSDYKKFDGIPIAQKEHDGHFEPEVTDFRAVDRFDAKLFEHPEATFQPKEDASGVGAAPPDMPKVVAGQVIVHGILENVDARKSVMTVKAVVGNDASSVLRLVALTKKPAERNYREAFAAELLKNVNLDTSPKLVNVPVRANADGVVGIGVGVAKSKLKIEDLQAGQVVMLQLAAHRTTGFVVVFVRVLSDEKQQEKP
jgi:uncharacterized protein (TIGR03067 family)